MDMQTIFMSLICAADVKKPATPNNPFVKKNASAAKTPVKKDDSKQSAKKDDVKSASAEDSMLSALFNNMQGPQEEGKAKTMMPTMQGQPTKAFEDLHNIMSLKQDDLTIKEKDGMFFISARNTKPSSPQLTCMDTKFFNEFKATSENKDELKSIQNNKFTLTYNKEIIAKDTTIQTCMESIFKSLNKDVKIAPDNIFNYINNISSEADKIFELIKQFFKPCVKNDENTEVIPIHTYVFMSANPISNGTIDDKLIKNIAIDQQLRPIVLKDALLQDIQSQHLNTHFTTTSNNSYVQEVVQNPLTNNIIGLTMVSEKTSLFEYLLRLEHQIGVSYNTIISMIKDNLQADSDLFIILPIKNSGKENTYIMIHVGVSQLQKIGAYTINYALAALELLKKEQIDYSKFNITNTDLSAHQIQLMLNYLKINLYITFMNSKFCLNLEQAIRKETIMLLPFDGFSGAPSATTA